MKIWIIVFAFCLAVLPSSGQVSEDEWDYQERINKGLERINRETEERIRRLHEYDWESLMQRSKPQKNDNSEQSKPRGGIQFSSDEPQRSGGTRKRSNGAVRRQQEDAASQQRHQQWLDECRERQKRDNEIRLEKERLRREQERREQERVYNEVYTSEYAREGVKTQQKIDAARWRTGEGAELLNRTHTAERLMTASNRMNFGNSRPRAGQHRLRPVKGRTKGYLDFNAIPWGTMKKGAIPYSEWSKNSKATYTVDNNVLHPVEKPLPQMTKRWEGDWDEIHRRISDDFLPQIKASIYFANNGEIPPLYYSEKADKYIAELNDGKTIVALSADGKTLDFLKMEETDDEVKDVLKNVGDANLSVHVGDLKGDAKGWSYKGQNIKVSADPDAKVSAEVGISDNKDFAEQKDKRDNDKDKDKDEENKGFFSKPEIGLEAKLDLYENSTKVERMRFSFGEKLTKGYQWSLSGGAEISAKSNVSSKSMSGSIKATTVEGSYGVQSIIPFYKGFVVSEAKVTASVGYNFKYKRKWAKAVPEAVGSRPVSLLPLSVGYEVKAFKYYSFETINKAMPTLPSK